MKYILVYIAAIAIIVALYFISILLDQVEEPLVEPIIVNEIIKSPDEIKTWPCEGCKG